MASPACVVSFAAALLLVVVAPSSAIDCTQLDLDLCQMHRPECTFRSATHTCEMRACWDYNGPVACKRDIYEFGDCKWDFAEEFCQKQNTPRPCWSYSHQCPEGQCTYDDVTHSCHLSGTVPSCWLYFGNDCPKSRCQLGGARGTVCYPKEAQVPCSDGFGASCDKSRCQVLPFGECWPKGFPLPCSRAYTAQDCDFTRCVYNGNRCQDVHEPLDCVKIFQEENCPENQCVWEPTTQGCWYKDEPIPCHRLSVPFCTSRADCRLVGIGTQATCKDVGETIDCSIFHYQSADCSDTYGCTGDCNSKQCIACAKGTNCTNMCGQQPSDINLECEAIFYEDSCVQNKKCHWIGNACHAGDVGPACSDYSTIDACVVNQGTLKCRWANDICVACASSEECKSEFPTQPPDTGRACEDYLIPGDVCPFPRCHQHDLSNQPSVCRNATCYDMHTAKSCKALDLGCEFNDKFNVCVESSDKIPCKFYSQDLPACDAQPNCEYNNVSATCTATDDGSTRCDALDWVGCPDNDRCVWDQGNAVCRAPRCCDSVTPDSCTGNCQWSHSESRCYEDTGKACKAYDNECDCPINNCAWKAFEVNKWACQPKACPDARSEAACSAVPGFSCTWDAEGSACELVDNSAKPCSQFDEETCPDNRCEFSFFNQDTQEVVDPPACIRRTCSSYQSEPECQAVKDCKFDYFSKSCYFDNGQPCASNTVGTCPTKRCTIAGPPGKETCQGLTCYDYTDSMECTAKSSCTWSTSYNACYPTSQGVDCSRLEYEFCVAPECLYDPVSDACFEASKGEPCTDIRYESSCSANKKCSWVATVNKCCKAGAKTC